LNFGETLGKALKEAKTIKHSVDEKLEEKIDRLIDEMLQTRKSIIRNWRIVQILMAISILGMIWK